MASCHLALLLLAFRSLADARVSGAVGSGARQHLRGPAAPVEVVLAHYNEDLAWIRDYEAPGVRFVVYSKGRDPPRSARRLPNVGRESHTFLHHIVQNYDALAPWTVFSQAARPSWGFQGGNSDSGHLTDNVSFADYLRPFPNGTDAFFVFSAASHFPDALQASRVGMMFHGLPVQSKDRCPPGGADGWSPWWFHDSHPHVARSGPNMLDFYHQYIALDENDGRPLTLAFAQGARFAVARSRVHSRPKAFYEALLRQLSREVDPLEGFWMEAAWYDVFHPRALQSKAPACDLPALLGAARPWSPPEANEAVRRRLLARGDLALLGPAGCGYAALSPVALGAGYAPPGPAALGARCIGCR